MKRALAMGGVVVMAVSVLLATPALADPTQPPTVGECTNDPTGETSVLNGEVVDCNGPHTGETIYIGTWTSDISPATADTYAPDSPERQRVYADLSAQYDACLTAFVDVVQDARKNYYIPSVFDRSATGPNAEQWADGARWFRCDLVASAAPSRGAPEQLLQLPAPAQLQGVMKRPLKTSKWALCAWASRTSWAAVSCDSSDASFTLAAGFSGSLFSWPGSAAKLWDKATAFCQSNPTVKSLKPKLSEVEAWRTESARITKANYKRVLFRCAVPR